MINTSYCVSHTTKIKFATTKTRLHTDSALSKELGADALVGDGKSQKTEVIGTAMDVSIECFANMPGPGDYELAAVVLPPKFASPSGHVGSGTGYVSGY
ncbi:Acyl-CoA N-acyltransferase [Penicillium verrucosum]|uniref:Acyl-CoA N-acyltransferase n=1 Tax=Penicillium verrucosum TaxID=60171 RepID=UPI00254592E1|nr:Acyl-CoA N-acyltransferase [Penicillium verrucosum]KAJ5940851.1 Acyl-CoA N-acyltransferase [Penicillium verrucosum]